MKVIYDKEADSLVITLRDDRLKESDEVRPRVIGDFGHDGGIVRFEIMQASRVVGNTEVQFEGREPAPCFQDERANPPRPSATPPQEGIKKG